MAVLFLILGILCILFFIGITLYLGWSNAFILFWSVIAFAFLAGAALLKYRQRHPFHIPTKVSVALIAFVSFCVVIFGIVEVQIIYHANAQPESGADYMVVLGAKVHGENVSLMLRKRLDQAYEYAVENEKTKIIVSGGQGPGETITEAEAMSRYLIAKGIKADRIIKEGHSTNTNENIRFSKKLMSLETPKVIVVTNGFHVLRAIRLCEKNGINNISGLGAPTPFGLHVNNYVREAAAYIKDTLVGNL